MINLNDNKLITSIDKANMLASIKALPNQCRQAWDDVSRLTVPPNYSQVNNIVVSGMGGSGLGSHFLYHLFFDRLKIPIQIINGYHLPASVNQNTLVLLSSYSGTTEETLSCALEAKEKKARILGITTGGKLAEFLSENNYPGYIFKPQYNPCNQPRMGLGYSILGQIALFNKCQLIKITDQEISELIGFISKEMINNDSKARQLVTNLYERIPIIISADFLSANAHVLSNQLNENSKNTSAYFLLPELNHHLLEGFTNPKAKKYLSVLMINSDLFSDRLKKRFILTKKILLKNKISVQEYNPTGHSKIMQIFSCLTFGSFISFYLSMLYKQNPSNIPWVDYFKKELAKI